MVGAIGFVGISAPGHAEHSDDERQRHQCRLHPIRALNRAVFTGEASLRFHGFARGVATNCRETLRGDFECRRVPMSRALILQPRQLLLSD